MPRIGFAYSSPVETMLEWTCTVPFGAPVEPDEYSQKQRRRRSFPQRPAVASAAAISSASATCGPAVAPRHDHVREVRLFAEQRRERRQQLDRDDQRARAAVAQHVVVVVRREQRVRRDRDDARLDRAEEGRREVDRVEQAEEHALLLREPESAQGVGAAIDALRDPRRCTCPRRRCTRSCPRARPRGCARPGRARRCSRAESRPAAGSRPSALTAWGGFALGAACGLMPVPDGGDTFIAGSSARAPNSIVPCGGGRGRTIPRLSVFGETGRTSTSAPVAAYSLSAIWLMLARLSSTIHEAIAAGPKRRRRNNDAAMACTWHPDLSSSRRYPNVGLDVDQAIAL